MSSMGNDPEVGNDSLHKDETTGAEQRVPANPELGFFWDGPEDDLQVPAGQHPAISVANALVKAAEQVAEKANPLKLDGPIDEDEWWSARMSPPAIVERWFYEDVGCFVAPGSTGKTTLLLFQVIHVVLDRPLFGHTIMAPGPVVILTAEDSRETLVARLRQMCREMNLTEHEMRQVREDVLITDVSGKGIKLTTVTKDVVMPSAQLDRLVVEIGVLCPSLLIVDPMVSFGVGESRVNDAEQGMIDAARRIRNAARCAVIYVHHTGKENARNGTTDHYSGRGGSALADGSRMVHVLKRLSPDEWAEATGDVLEEESAGFLLARAKMTWCPPQPDIYLKRHGYTFSHFDHIGATEGAKRVNQIADDKVWEFLRDGWTKGERHTQNTLISAKVLPQRATRDTVGRLLNAGRLTKEASGTGGRGGTHHHLRPIELPLAT